MRRHRRRRGNPLQWYVRSRLRRRLFAWFGVAILATAMLAGGAAWVLGGGSRSWHDRVESIERFVGGRFARVWEDPVARDELARSAARELGLGLILRDANGTELATYGPACEHPRRITVVEGGRELGEVDACVPAWGGGPGPFLGTFAVGAFVLWMASGFIAYRLTRHLATVVKVTQAIGEGKLDARVDPRALGNDELRVIGDAVNEMAGRIQGMLTAERELLASVSHEIRTPLGHLRVLLDVARQGDADPEVIDELEREVVAIDELVGQLLAHSRVEFGTIDHRELDGIELAIRALERADLDPTLLEAEAESLKLRGDAALILQALANLLRNAAEHGGGVTRLAVRRDAAGVAFDVEDHGAGFAEEDLAHAFESFHRGGDSKEERRGSLGLGLALVQRIAKAHGGEAKVQNLRPGARVTLVVPSG